MILSFPEYLLSTTAEPPMCEAVISSAAAFHSFPKLPAEIRLKIWQFALPASRIIAARLRHGGAPLFPTLPIFPPSMLILMHVNHEAREEILSTFKLLRFPVAIIQDTQSIRQQFPTCHSYITGCFPARRCERERSVLEKRWESRGYHIVNVRSDLVFFGRWTTAELRKAYATDFIPAMTFALSEVRYLSISMHSWKDARASWLTVLRGLDRLRKVLFVKEMLDYSSSAARKEYRLIGLADANVADYESPGDPWKARILMDIKAEKEMFPQWKMPKIEFKAITNQFGCNLDGGMDLCRSLYSKRYMSSMSLRDTWRR